jgi:hypothetical protein
VFRFVHFVLKFAAIFGPRVRAVYYLFPAFLSSYNDVSRDGSEY